jgi:hypothetical protein
MGIGIVDTAARDGDWPARRVLQWLRSIDPTTDHYRIQQQQDGGDYELVATVVASPHRWRYELITPQLDDGSTYAWRVQSRGATGRSSTIVSIAAEKVVRTPDPVNFTLSVSSARVTITEAA